MMQVGPVWCAKSSHLLATQTLFQDTSHNMRQEALSSKVEAVLSQLTKSPIQAHIARSPGALRVCQRFCFVRRVLGCQLNPNNLQRLTLPGVIVRCVNE
jgi:hypothetical protein